MTRAGEVRRPRNPPQGSNNDPLSGLTSNPPCLTIKVFDHQRWSSGRRKPPPVVPLEALSALSAPDTQRAAGGGRRKRRRRRRRRTGRLRLDPHRHGGRTRGRAPCREPQPHRPRRPRPLPPPRQPAVRCAGVVWGVWVVPRRGTGGGCWLEREGRGRVPGGARGRRCAEESEPGGGWDRRRRVSGARTSIVYVAIVDYHQRQRPQSSGLVTRTSARLA